MEIESTVTFLFSIYRIEKLIGQSTLNNKLEGQQGLIMRYFIREVLHKQLKDLNGFINKESSKQANLVKITMVLKCLTYNRKILEDNFDPYIKDTIKETVSIVKNLLDTINPESNEVTIVSYANLL